MSLFIYFFKYRVPIFHTYVSFILFLKVIKKRSYLKKKHDLETFLDRALPNKATIVLGRKCLNILKPWEYLSHNYNQCNCLGLMRHFIHLIVSINRLDVDSSKPVTIRSSSMGCWIGLQHRPACIVAGRVQACKPANAIEKEKNVSRAIQARLSLGANVFLGFERQWNA